MAWLLPRRTRERLFFPAFFDALLDSDDGNDDVGERHENVAGIRMLALLLDSIRVSCLAWLLRDRPATRPGRVALFLGLVLIALVIAARVLRPY